MVGNGNGDIPNSPPKSHKLEQAVKMGRTSDSHQEEQKVNPSQLNVNLVPPDPLRIEECPRSSFAERLDATSQSQFQNSVRWTSKSVESLRKRRTWKSIVQDSKF